MKKILLLFLLFYYSFCFGQKEDSLILEKSYKRNLIKEGFVDIKDVAISPIKWNTKEWIAASGIIVSASAMYCFDNDIRKFFQKQRNEFTNKLSSKIFEPTGDIKYLAGSTCALWLYGVLLKKKKEKNLSITLAKALAISSLFTYSAKNIFHRHRPCESPHSAFIWDGPSINKNFTSFYSGHTISAFTFATVVSSQYKKNTIIPITIYGLATLTALSRINNDKHWATDLFIGAAMGYGIGKLVYNNDFKRTKIYPEISSQYIGLKVILD